MTHTSKAQVRLPPATYWLSSTEAVIDWNGFKCTYALTRWRKQFVTSSRDPFVFIFLMAHSMHNDWSRRILRLLLRIALNNTTEYHLRGVFRSLKIGDESAVTGQRWALNYVGRFPLELRHLSTNPGGQSRASNQANPHVSFFF